MIKLKYILFVGVTLIATTYSCGSKDISSQPHQSASTEAKTRKARFSGNYNREFNDLHNLHITSAVNME